MGYCKFLILLLLISLCFDSISSFSFTDDLLHGLNLRGNL